MKKCLKLICLIIMTLFLVGWKGNEKYEITIDKNETVSINYILGYDKDYYDILFENMGLTEYDDEILWNFIESANNHLDMDPRDNGYVLERYDDGTYKGLSYNKTYDNILPLVDNNASISGDILTTEYLKLFTYKNNTYNLNLRLVKSDTSAPMTATFVVSLPNKPESHNATTVSQDGRTLTWDLYETSSIDLSFKINPIPWNSILIGGGIGIALVFLLMALSYMKKKGKIDVKHMPKSVAGTSNAVDIPNNNVDNLEVYNNRIENLYSEFLNSIDIVTARAVTNLPVLTEFAIPLVKANKYFIAMKGNAEEELENSMYAIKQLNCSIDNVITFDLYNNSGVRTLISIKKNKNTELKNIRPYDKIIKKPLQKRGK